MSIELKRGTPFKKDLTKELIGSGAEFNVRKFKSDENLVVKELKNKEDTHLHLDPELETLSLVEFAQQRYQRAKDLMERFEFGFYMPKTDIVIGHK